MFYSWLAMTAGLYYGGYVLIQELLDMHEDDVF